MYPLALAALATFIVDQASKWAVVFDLDLRHRLVIDVAPPYLRFVMGWNEGVNFGLLAGHPGAMRWVLVGLALVICLWVARFSLRDGRVQMEIAGGALIGGALGNVFDRLVHGAVADFLNMSCCGIANPYAFNLADVAVFGGAAALVLWGRAHKTP
ncbi:MAG: signal peptidase II [Rhodobacteraceae bacterium]|nr:signal peptidase II [Paracoccaceae bacterium]